MVQTMPSTAQTQAMNLNVMNSMPISQWGSFSAPVFMPNMNQAQMSFAQMQNPLFTGMMHPNQDPNSIPSPLTGVQGMTSTQAKYKANGTTDKASEPKGHAGPYTHNMYDKEPEPVKQIFSQMNRTNSTQSHVVQKTI